MEEAELFFRDFDPHSPVSTGKRWLIALGARVLIAFKEALKHTEVSNQLLGNLNQMWVFGLLLAAWFGLSLFPATAPIANAINGLLVVIGIASLVDRFKEIGEALYEGLSAAYRAESMDDLKRAGQLLAPALTGVVVTAIEVLITHSAFKAAEAIIAKRLPMPEWLRRLLREEPKSSAKPSPSEKTAEGGRSADEPASRNPQEETAKQSKEASKKSTGRKLAEAARRTAALEGGRAVSHEVGDSLDGLLIALLVGGSIVATGAIVIGISNRGRR